MIQFAEPMPIGWNALRLASDGTTHTDEFSGAWQAYWWDGWERIKHDFREDGGGFVHDESPRRIIAPALATGRITLVNEQRYNPHTGATWSLGDVPALEIDHPYASPVEGRIIDGRPWQVVYPNAFGDGVDLVVGAWWARAMRGEHLIRVRTMPANGANAVVTERVYTALKIPGWDGSPVEIGETGAALQTINGDNGIRVRPAVAWYYDQDGGYHQTPISLVAQRFATFATLTKTIPAWFIAEALAAGGYVLADETTTDFFPDANAETNSVDGYVYQSGANSTWSSLTNGAGSSFNDSSTSLTVSSYASTATSNRWSIITRGVYDFYTSSIGAGSTISSASLAITGTAKTNSFPSGGASAYLCKISPASHTGLAGTDYGTADKTLQSDGAFDLTSWNAAGVNSFTLNATGSASISKTGNTALATLSYYDQSSSAPPWSGTKDTSLTAASADAAGTGSDPKLTVTYTSGGGGSSNAGQLLLLGCGA